MSIRSIKLDSKIVRGAIAAAAILCIVLTFLTARSFFANTVASRAVYKEIAEIAVELAPSDPQTHLAHAVLLEKTFFPADQTRALAEYEKAVALSPNDFNLWLELGRARERNGDPTGAEIALRRSLALAPGYARVQWTLGNFLLRQNKPAEAFAEIRKSAQNDPQYANPAIASAWQIFEGNTLQIKDFVGDSVNLKAAFSALLAREKRFDESAEIWKSLPENDRRTVFKANGEEIYQKMLEAKKYRAALSISAGIGENPPKYAADRLTDGSFEAVQPKASSIFDWQIGDGGDPSIVVDDSQKRAGNLSLVLVFNNSSGKIFRSLSQTAAVEAGRKYVFEGFYRSDLKAAATVRWEIIDAMDGKTLAVTEAVLPKTDWTQFKTEFNVPETSEGIIIRLGRAGCNAAACPIDGKVWFDDFGLRQIPVN